MAAKKSKVITKTAGTDYFRQPVTVTLLKDNFNYKDDVTITYNGVNYQIQRGIPVQVPMFIKLILEDGFRQQLTADNYSEKLSKVFQDKAKVMI